jgi:hypothetical protein
MRSFKVTFLFAPLQLCYYHAVEAILSRANYQRHPGKQAIARYLDDEQEKGHQK